jgi:hypothetical protein
VGLGREAPRHVRVRNTPILGPENVFFFRLHGGCYEA